MARRERAEAQSLPLVPELPVWERGMNPRQLEVIRHVDGPIGVYAGAGSGKTASVIRRVARLVSDVGVSADRVFCVTFSRAGAAEMDARVRGLGIGGAEVRTWHAFCGRVLREEGTAQGRWKVDDKNAANAFVKKAAGWEYVNWKGADVTKVRSFITVCKANYWWPTDPEALELARKKFGPAAQRAVDVYAVSEKLTEDAQLLTFDNMLMYVVRHFIENPAARENWAAKFDYVIQDEAQDANRIQVMIAESLAKDHRNYMVVGDPGQAIFGFRGSDPKYLTDFETAWPGAKIVTMAQNYRSGSAIVRVANDVIRQGAHRLPEDMSAERGVEGKVEVVSANTLDDEADELVDFCKRRLAEGGSLADVTVLYRLNAQSRAPEEALLRERIPYVIVGGVNFYERKEVKDLLAYLRLAAGRDPDGDAIRRCINAPFRYLGAKFVERVMSARAQYGAQISWTDVVRIAAQQAGIKSNQKASAAEWVELIDEVSDLVVNGAPTAESHCVICECPAGACSCVEHECELGGKTKVAGAAEVLQRIVTRTNYVAWLEKEEGEESIEGSHGANVRELQRVAAAFDSVPEFLSFVDVQIREAELNKRKRGEKCVTLMTAHRSKGLEWPVVWVVGCNDTILPHAKGDIEEERRLMYVATTRARDHLIVSHVQEMATRTGVRSVEPSPFLSVFPGSCVYRESVVEDEAPEVCDVAGDAEDAGPALDAEELLDATLPGAVLITEEERVLGGASSAAKVDLARAAKAFGL